MAENRYLVFARKWRPQTFEDVIGQEHITRTLQNAIKAGRIVYANGRFTGEFSSAISKELTKMGAAWSRKNAAFMFPASRLPADIGNRLGIFGETRATVTRTRVEELGANASVEAHAFGDVMHIGAKSLANFGHLIDEGDLGRQKGVGCILDHLGRLDVGDDKGRFNQVQWCIDILHEEKWRSR